MTKKGIIFQVSIIIFMVIVFLLSSCSQAAMSDQDQKNDEIKMSDSSNKGILITEIANIRKYYIIIPAMQAQPGWDWCASAATCMMSLDLTCGWINQTDLYKFKQYSETFPEYNATNCIWNYKNFHGYPGFVTGTSLEFLARNGFDKNHLFINVRKSYWPYKKFTIVIFGYDLAKYQVAIFNPQTGFYGWVDYNSILSYLYQDGIYSYSDSMIGVTYDPSYYK